MKLENITSTEILLYCDLCRAHNRVDDLIGLNKEQVSMLTSIVKNGGEPTHDEHTGKRRWKMPYKKKQGGYLCYSTLGNKFFKLSEKLPSEK